MTDRLFMIGISIGKCSMLIPIFYVMEAIYGKISVLVTEKKEDGEEVLWTMLFELQVL